MGTLPGWLHLRALLMPVATLVFVAWRPDSPWVALGFALFPFFLDFVETQTAEEKRQPPPRTRSWPFDLILYGLFACHLAILPLSAALIVEKGWLSVHTAAVFSMVVVTSCLGGAICGHELIHRRHGLHVAMGRLLLASLFYEHLYTEHLRGHHPRVGTLADVSTARFGESYVEFLRRNLLGQVVSAWRLAPKRVLEGFVLEALIAGAFFTAFSWTGLAFLALQAAVVQLVWMAVHYFEHWGLVRGDEISAWDSDNKASVISMTGLARHADHHARPRKPFQDLARLEESPKLPRGYGGMIFLSIFENRKFQELMTAELARLGRLPETVAVPSEAEVVEVA